MFVGEGAVSGVGGASAMELFCSCGTKASAASMNMLNFTSSEYRGE